MNIAILLLTGFALALLGSHLVGRYAVELGLLDIPNDRSFHSRPVPRGGGLGVAFAFLLSVTYLLFVGFVDVAAWAGFTLSGLLLVGVGFVDDRNHIPARWRFLAQLIAVVIGLLFLGHLPAIQIFVWQLPIDWLIYPIIVLLALWWINLYNFMDGIDGIAAVQALTMLLAALVLIPDDGMGVVLLLTLAVAVFGFLCMNWSPARVFMGDAGSTFLGYVLVFLALYCFQQGLLSVWAWLILGGCFLVDATCTLIRRILSGQTWYEAHRSHAYQHGAQSLMERAQQAGLMERSARSQAHRRVCYVVAAINLIWLMPMAWLAELFVSWAPIVLLVAWLPLLALVIKLRAGQPS